MGLERARRGVMAMDVGACVLQLLRLEVYDGAARSRMSVRERERAHVVRLLLDRPWTAVIRSLRTALGFSGGLRGWVG